MKILVTGASGFIGFSLSLFLLKKKIQVIGIDNLNNYYDVDLKKKRLKILKKFKNFEFLNLDLSNKNTLFKKLKKKNFSYVVHLAAQAGVRYSILNPDEYTKSNLIGFSNILELVRNKKIKHLLFASTSSVYGLSKSKSFDENLPATFPIQYYAATKRANELMAHSYSYLFNIPSTALRFFTVYGPWGRPDMALFKFTKNILLNKYIEVFNFGNHKRDFTYIDDVVKSIYLAIKKIPKKNLTGSLSKSKKVERASKKYTQFFDKILSSVSNEIKNEFGIVLNLKKIKKISAIRLDVIEQIILRHKNIFDVNYLFASNTYDNRIRIISTIFKLNKKKGKR